MNKPQTHSDINTHMHTTVFADVLSLDWSPRGNIVNITLPYATNGSGLYVRNIFYVLYTYQRQQQVHHNHSPHLTSVVVLRDTASRRRSAGGEEQVVLGGGSGGSVQPQLVMHHRSLKHAPGLTRQCHKQRSNTRAKAVHGWTQFTYTQHKLGNHSVYFAAENLSAVWPWRGDRAANMTMEGTVHFIVPYVQHLSTSMVRAGGGLATLI